jgi:hypothetical protein
MRRIFWSFLAVLFVGVCTPYAHADSITEGTLNFTVTQVGPFHGTFIPTGSFVFDNTTNTLAIFTVNWDGAVFDFAPSFIGVDLAVLGEAGTWSAGGNAGVDTPHPATPFFELGGMLGTLLPPGQFTDGGARASGTYTVNEEVRTPEPSSFAHILLGLGALLMVMARKLCF